MKTADTVGKISGRSFYLHKKGEGPSSKTISEIALSVVSEHQIFE